MDKESVGFARSMFKHYIFVLYSTSKPWCKTNNNEAV